MQRKINWSKDETSVQPRMIQLMMSQQSLFNYASVVVPVLESRFGKGCDDLILNVYLFGSRLYGTANETSDFDLFVLAHDSIEEVVKGEEAPVPNTFYIRHISEQFSCDITVQRQSEFLSKLRRCCIHEMICLFVPDLFVLKKRIDLLQEFCDTDYTIPVDTMKGTILGQTNMIWESSKRAFSQSLTIENEMERNEELYKAKKGIVHTLRFFLYGTQIATSGKIYDYSVCNEYTLHEWVADHTMQNWDQFEQVFHPIHCMLKEQFLKAGK